jgi:hypothetical protein
MKNLFSYAKFTSRRLRYKLGARPIKSSFPFLSGDTYRMTCDVDASSRGELSRISIASDSIFTTPDQLQNLVDFLNATGLSLPESCLVIHNGDAIPDFTTMDFLSTKFMRIYSTNWLGSHPKIVPIPIGLENIRFLRNGIPSDFKRLRPRNRIEFSDRPIDLLVAFSLHTNPVERRAALSAARMVPGVKIVQNFIYPYEYLELVSRSKFVLSPPGNGPDCHRTWESIYLGAVPIVLESAWPFKDFNLPVAQVSKWEDILSVVKGGKVFEFPSPEQIHDLFSPKFGVENRRSPN